jgi:phage tail sheath protein FI
LGTLVWGARTLAGNSNEWRYISVRRLFISVEESIEKATAFAVFEPNDATTWLKVKGMIDSYLYTLWQRGALQGAKAEQAYFVNIGLNKTMTPADIDNGLLIVEIGLAAVRPAEFIVLRFSHKLAQ